MHAKAQTNIYLDTNVANLLHIIITCNSMHNIMLTCS